MNLSARKIGFGILLGIAFYLPLEDFVLRWLPFPRGLLVVLRQAPEVLVWLVGLGAVALNLARHGSIRVVGRRVDRFLIGFLVVAIASVYLNDAKILMATVSLKAMLRYIPLIYALIMLAPDDAQLARVHRVMIVAVCIQAVIGLAEWLGGQPVRSFFSVIHFWDGYSLVGAPVDRLLSYEKHDINGTIARPVGYAYFILVGLIVWIVRSEKRPVQYWVGVGIALVLTYQAHSRMAVFASILVIILHQVAVHGMKKTVWLTVLLMPLMAAVTLSLGSVLAENFYFLDVFSQEYQENALNQRLGLIVYLLPNVFNGGITLLGYSPDLGIVAAAVGENFELPTIIAFVFVQIVEDVYWLALLLYYGFVGFTLFVLFFGKLTALVLRLYRRAATGPAKQSASVALLLLVMSIPLNAINQTFEFRVYAYYLWLFVGIAIVSARNAMQTNEKQVVEAT